jgi:hypothetical protein
MNTLTGWTPDVKASVWVAIGTLLLAVATAWSVYETRLVLRGEDRRFELGRAPLIVAGRLVDEQQLFEGLRLTNLGEGVAMDVSFEMTAYFLMYLDGAGPNEVPPEEVETTRVDVPPWHESGYTPVIAKGDKREIGVVPFNELYQNELVEIATVEIKYRDMFGNVYHTTYTDFDARRYSWVIPAQLKRKT